MQRGLDVAARHIRTPTPSASAVTGLSGGGWQTIILSSLDPRVTLANPVAGYSSFVTRTQFPIWTWATPSRRPCDLGKWPTTRT